MAVVPSEYWVRVKVSGAYENAFNAARALARKLASENPGRVFEVEEDKVWASIRCDAPGGNDGTQELSEPSDTTPPCRDEYSSGVFC